MRRVLPLVAAISLVLAAVAPTLAAGITFTGYVDSEIKLRPNADDRWTGRTGIEIGAALSSTNKYSLKLGFFDEDKYFWEKYSSWIFQPSEISLYAQGALWTGGPVLKGTLGDYKMLGPVYIAGDDEIAAMRGVMVEGLPLGVIRASVYAGWPRADLDPLEAGSTTKTWGGSVNIANYKGLKLDAYGAVRRGEYTIVQDTDIPLAPDVPGALWVAPDGTAFTFDHIDEPFATSGSSAGGLWLYTRNFTGATTISVYSDAAYVREDGSIVRYIRSNQYGSFVRPIPPTANSDYAYLIVGWTGADQKHLWMRAHIEAPYQADPNVKFASRVPQRDYHSYSQAVGALEGSFSLIGFDVKGQLGRLLTADGYRRVVGNTSTDVPRAQTLSKFYIVSASTGIPLGNDLATKPLTITAEYRNISNDFTPWARSTVTDSSSSKYNRIEAQRGQAGINVVASTAFLPANPVDATLTYDSYTKDEQLSQSMTLELATKLSGYELTSKLGTGGTEVGIARNFDLGVKDVSKFRPSLKLVMPSGSTSPTSILGLSAVLSLGAFRNINLDVSHETTGTEGVTTLTGSYKAPNGWEFKAGWTSDEEKVDDTYVSLYYKVNL